MAYHNNHLGKTGYVYILSNYTRAVLYISVCNDLEKRIAQHKRGKGQNLHPHIRSSIFCIMRSIRILMKQ